MPLSSVLSYGSLMFGLVAAFDMSTSTNLAVYWGQNSYGAANPSDTSGYQQPISYYCQDGTVDIIPIAFLDEFYGEGNLPVINLANTCNTNDNSVFSGTGLLDCSFLASDIEACQSAGTAVTISLGGATGGVGFTDDTEAEAYAQTIWDLFLGGTSTTRPFGAAILDGIDMDIEGGAQTGYPAFITALRALMDGGDKQYYITAAPQCPYPDAYIGTTLDAVGFDAVFVQFYNNYCGLTSYSDANDWDFSTWDNWATTVSPNPDVKVYIGAPASSSAAGSGYVDASTITTIVQQTMAEYSSFGGVMLWDASQAYANDRYDISCKDALTGGTSSGGGGGTTTTTTITTTTTTTTSAAATTTTVGTGSCSSVAAWTTGVAYVGGDQVTYDGDLWTASYWTENDTPGGSAGVWVNDGACSSSAASNAKAAGITPAGSAAPKASSNPAASVSGKSSNVTSLSNSTISGNATSSGNLTQRAN